MAPTPRHLNNAIATANELQESSSHSNLATSLKRGEELANERPQSSMANSRPQSSMANSRPQSSMANSQHTPRKRSTSPEPAAEKIEPNPNCGHVFILNSSVMGIAADAVLIPLGKSSVGKIEVGCVGLISSDDERLGQFVGVSSGTTEQGWNPRLSRQHQPLDLTRLC